MKYINLTPHPVVLSHGGITITFDRKMEDPVARLEQFTETTTIAHEIAPGMQLELPMTIITRSEVYNLPEPQEGVLYIVSTMVANSVKRPDVIAPITDSTCERDEKGRVVSVKGFQTFVMAENAEAVLELRRGLQEASAAMQVRGGTR